MLCQICQDTHFYEDGQGNMCCISCGTQSQDYLPESFDVDEGMVAARQGGRMRMLKMKSAASTVKKARVSEETSLRHFLQLFQSSLKLLTAEFLDAGKVEDAAVRQSFTDCVKTCWIDYLNVWSNCGCDINDAFHDKLRDDHFDWMPK